MKPVNTVKLTQSKNSLKIDAEINGEKVSEFSDLSTLLQAPFLNVAEKIIPQLDEEIYDGYEIVFSGYMFQYRLLLFYAGKSQYCRNVFFESDASVYTEEETEQIFESVCTAHGLSVARGKRLPSVYSTVSLGDVHNLISQAPVSEADISVLEDRNQIQSVVSSVILLIGDCVDVFRINDRRVFQLPTDMLADFFQFFVSYNYHLAFVDGCRNALSYVKLSKAEEKKIDSALSNQPGYYLSEIPSVIDGEDCITFEFESFPKNRYSVSSDNYAVLNVFENRIVALSAGSANIVVKDAQGNTVHSQSISTVWHHYATEIRVVPRFNQLKLNERNRIDAIVLPQNAEDANEVTFTSSDERVVTVDGNGNVLALGTGTATITVCARKISSSVQITVMPNLERVYFTEETVSLKIGHSAIVECHTIPENASTNGFVWQFDNHNIASINYTADGKKCKITAATQSEGKGNLRCFDPQTGYCAVCPVDVYARVRLNFIDKIIFLLSVIGFFYPPLQLAPIALDVLFLFINKEEKRKKVYIFNIVMSVVLAIAGLCVFT